MILDTLLVSSPGEDGGLFIVHEHDGVRWSNRPVTGLLVGSGQLIFAYQENGGKTVRVLINGSVEDMLLSDEPLDLHDLFAFDGSIYAADTENNRVICFDKNFKISTSWSLPGENDSAHLNSVTVYQGQLLASIFGRFQYHRQYKDGTLGKGEVVNIQTGRTFIGGLSQPHSLTVVDDLLYLCSSEDKELRVYNGEKIIQKVPVPGYARGLAIGLEKIYVGLSLTRNIETVKHGAKNASIAIIDRETMQVENFVYLSAKEIYDIKIASVGACLLRNLVGDFVKEQMKLEELIALYKRGYESYKRENTHFKRLNTNLQHENTVLQHENTVLQHENTVLQHEIDMLKFKRLRRLIAKYL